METVAPAAPSFSVVMPCYNAAAHLARSVGSVLAQTEPGWELIVVDDGSTDNSRDLVAAFNDSRIRLVAQANQGASAARNRGVAEARGEFLAFLDADDVWAPEFLAQLSTALRARPDAALAYCGWQNVGLPGARGEPFIPQDYERPGKVEALLAGCRWPVHAVMVRREAVINAGGFDRSLPNCEDYALWLNLATKAAIVRVPQVLAYYHFHSQEAQKSRKFVARRALAHLRAQTLFIEANPELVAGTAPERMRDLTYGELQRRGFECYWARDLPAARTIFRAVMKGRYGTFGDWKHMVPSLLPLRIHEHLVQWLDSMSPRREDR